MGRPVSGPPLLYGIFLSAAINAISPHSSARTEKDKWGEHRNSEADFATWESRTGEGEEEGSADFSAVSQVHAEGIPAPADLEVGDTEVGTSLHAELMEPLIR